MNKIHDLIAEFEAADKNNYSELYSILQKLISLIPYLNLDSYDKTFKHVLKSARKILTTTPSDNISESDLALINRELMILISSLKV